MNTARTRPGFWATGAALVCLLVAAGMHVSARQAVQPAPDQGPLMADAYYRNIQILKGIPIDTFFDVMGMFASSMGDDCTYCHVKEAIFTHSEFGTPTPRILRARQMIVMMETLNKNYFGGAPRVTCFTCHRGSNSPAASPDFFIQYGTPREDPNVLDFPPDTRTSADAVLDKYLQALGGAAALAKVSSFAAKGTYSGFDTGFAEVPADVFGKAPNQRTVLVHLFNGDSHRVFDGRSGWWTGPDSPAPIETLTSGNLDRYRLEALVAFPATMKQAFTQWKVGRTLIDDRQVVILQGTNPGSGLLPVNLYFDDESGLLVRWVRWNLTRVGPVPTEIDYSDYRDVNGIKMPFKWTASQTYMQMTIKLNEIRTNVPVEAAQFLKPPPGTPKA